MPREIARLNEDGVIIAVEPVSDQDHRTDPNARTVRLDEAHDMRNHINDYKWDWSRQTFLPLSAEPLDVAERDTSELVEGFIETAEDTESYLTEIHLAISEIVSYIDNLNLSEEKLRVKLTKFKLSSRAKRTIKEFRKNNARRRRGTVEA